MCWRRDGAAVRPEAPVLVTLHGFRMNEDSFSLLLQGLFDLPIHILSFRGPRPAEGLTGAGPGASWYDYDGDQDRFRRELDRVEQTLLSAIDGAESTLGLRPGARFLLGFSQGGYCGSVIALRRIDRFRGMIISGARVKAEILGPEMKAAAEAGFSALLCHGERDAAVPVEGAEKGEAALLAAGVDATLARFPGGHSLGRLQISAIRAWLSARLDVTPGRELA
ncbi:MAG: hypothetical protein IT349_10970 [Candidatus Eisenbacteria bacterium]|nr:hypothetical protein [Candidatus Eisenbacteria bacterium]